MSCPACGHEAVAGASFCIACGEPLPGRCARCDAALPPEARFCPGCGARVASPRASEPIPAPPRTARFATPEQPTPSAAPERATKPSPPPRPAPPPSDPMEDLELEEAIERLRERDRRQRQARRGAVVVGVVAVLAILGTAAWLALRAAHTAPPVRVAAPPPANGAAAAPPAPAPPAEADEANRGAAAESATPPDAPYVGAMAELPEATTDAPPEVERDLPARGPSAREEAARRAARTLPRAPDATPPRREKPQPEPAAPTLSSRSRPGSIDREVRVEIATEALADGLTSYTVRLRERDGRPVTDATVSIRGRRADGALLEATLDRAAEPGAYRAVVRRPAELTDARVRVAGVNRVQEVPLPDTPR